jgi:hypothetical protein
MRFVFLLLTLGLHGCNGDVFTREGVTDGDTFYLAPTALTDQDPVLQSWVTYSLIKSTCQLQLGGRNPARAGSFACECDARRHLAATWAAKKLNYQPLADKYLDALVRVSNAGFMPEYTAQYFSKHGWQRPENLRMAAFKTWRRQHLRRHRVQTRIIGSWGFSKTTAALAGDAARSD